jgi:1-deoxy-D-xylulose-5-phosphate reductoisomerase
MAALGEPDMTVPIRFALTFPRRSDRVNPSPFDFFKAGNSNLTFEPVREDVFPSLAMAREAFESGGLMPLVLNAANEAAVSRFLKGTIAFTDIFSLARRALDQFSHLAATEASSFDVMMGAHRQVLEFVDPAGDSSTDLQERL